MTAPFIRRRHLCWGATVAEANCPLPGDQYFPKAQFIATRAITVDAPPEAVWPWLVQVGCLRAGWYSNDLLDNLGHPSATTIVPGLQVLEVGHCGCPCLRLDHPLNEQPSGSTRSNQMHGCSG